MSPWEISCLYSLRQSLGHYFRLYSSGIKIISWTNSIGAIDLKLFKIAYYLWSDLNCQAPPYRPLYKNIKHANSCQWFFGTRTNCVEPVCFCHLQDSMGRWCLIIVSNQCSASTEILEGLSETNTTGILGKQVGLVYLVLYLEFHRVLL